MAKARKASPKSPSIKQPKKTVKKTQPTKSQPISPPANRPLEVETDPDNIRYQSEVPGLMEMFYVNYRRKLATVNAARLAEGKPPVDVEKNLRCARPFTDFCEKFLKDFPSVQTFPVTGGIGIVFANYERCVIGANGADDKDMQPSNFIPITQGKGGIMDDMEPTNFRQI